MVTLRLTLIMALCLFCNASAWAEPPVPQIVGDWWQISGDPDLGEYTTEKQQPVDFGIWQAADGTWQLWSCIRYTACGGNTRLFYRWEGDNLTDPDWTPMGIAQEARPELGESPGGMQAPHVVFHEGLYVMAYGDWVNICFSKSFDGKNFERVIQPDGKTAVFSEGEEKNTRDPMLIKIGDLWHCYYTAVSADRKHGHFYCRTSPDLEKWSDSVVVCYGGKIGPIPWQIECPHVVEAFPGRFFLFRNQFYGENMRNWVYYSRNPLNFGIDEDSQLVTSLEVAAPEIIFHDRKYYIASLMRNLKGIKLARFAWEGGEVNLDP